MSRDTGKHCACVASHRPPVLGLDQHHILASFLGGDNTPGNLIWICGNTHRSTHEILTMFVNGGPMTYRQVQSVQDRPVSRYAYDLALRGYDLWVAAVLAESHLGV